MNVLEHRPTAPQSDRQARITTQWQKPLRWGGEMFEIEMFRVLLCSNKMNGVRAYVFCARAKWSHLEFVSAQRTAVFFARIEDVWCLASDVTGGHSQGLFTSQPMTTRGSVVTCQMIGY